MDTAETMEYELPQSAPFVESSAEGGDTATDKGEPEENENLLRAPTLQLGEVIDDTKIAEGETAVVDSESNEKPPLDDMDIPPSQPHPISPSQPGPTPPEEEPKEDQEENKPREDSKDQGKDDELMENGSGVPWVSRTNQQVFKGSKAALAEKDPAAKKRPASRGRGGKGRGKGKAKAKGKKLAKVVEVVSGEEGEEEQGEKDEEIEPDLTPKNLEAEFAVVASSQEAEAGTPASTAKPKKKARAPPKTHKKPAAKGKVYKRPSAKSQASSPKVTKRKGSKTPQKSTTPKAKAKGSKGQGKGTFAGRRPPKGGQAKVRFDVMQSVFDASIAEFATAKSQVQAGLGI